MALNKNDIAELLSAKVIDQQTGDKILAYYKSKNTEKPNRLVLVFGVLGALLIGLGLILIVAHNWDDLSKSVKTGIAIGLLVLAQALAMFALIKKPDNKTWTEATTVFWALMIGASIALISQIYHISGDFDRFILTWLLLALPIVYLMQSSITAILYMIGVAIYGFRIDTWRGTANIYYFLGLLILLLPYYIYLIRKDKDDNARNFLHWLIAFTLMTNLYHFYTHQTKYIFAGYAALLSLFYMIGKLPYFDRLHPVKNSYKFIGVLGSAILLIILSFKDIWQHILKFSYNNYYEALITTIILSITAIILLVYLKKKHLKTGIFAYLLIWIFINYFLMYISTFIPFILINLSVLALGIYYILQGQKLSSLWHLNFGLILITALIISRFFDMDMSFATRGLLFVLVGTGFFAANYQILKKQKK